jgi:hypothetical protein
MSVVGTKLPRMGRQSMSAPPQFSDIDLLGNGKCVVDLDPEIAKRMWAADPKQI